MSRRRFRRVAILAALALLAMPAMAHANAVTDWNRIASDTLIAFPGPAGGAGPTVQLNFGLTQGAVYDAVNAIEPRNRPYLLGTPFAPTSSKDAAAATAAYRMLSSIVSGVPATIPFPNRATVLANLATQYAASLAAIPDGAAKANGIAAGEAAAAAMLAARTNDGRFGPSAWVPNSAPGHWRPLHDPVTGAPLLDPTPWVGDVKPFLLRSGSQFRTEGPNSLRSRAWARDYTETKALGSANSSVRTADETHAAIFWQGAGGPGVQWNGVARSLAAERGLDDGRTALLLATMNLSAADAAINCWNDKYHFDFWRPWNAIPNGDTDDNPATVADPTWTPLISAPYPEHPSGHLCIDGASTKALRTFFDTDKVTFGITSSRFPGETRQFKRFSAAIEEIVNARIWAGLHFRTADVQARGLGREVAKYMSKHYFQPLC